MGAVTSKQTESPMLATSSKSDSKQDTDLSLTAEEQMRLKQIENVPKYNAPETFEAKLYRKVSGFHGNIFGTDFVITFSLKAWLSFRKNRSSQ